MLQSCLLNSCQLFLHAKVSFFTKYCQTFFQNLYKAEFTGENGKIVWGGNYREDMAMGNRDDRRDGMAGRTLNIGCKVEETDYRGGISASKKVLETKCKQANKAI